MTPKTVKQIIKQFDAMKQVAVLNIIHWGYEMQDTSMDNSVDFDEACRLAEEDFINKGMAKENAAALINSAVSDGKAAQKFAHEFGC